MTSLHFTQELFQQIINDLKEGQVQAFDDNKRPHFQIHYTAVN